MLQRCFALGTTLLLAGVSHAALFSNTAFFSTAPNSQLGPVTNNLTITNTANGFVVSGQVLINLPGPASGTLLSWVVDRQLDPTYGTATLNTTTVLDGFSAPPPGLLGATSGFTSSEFNNYPGASTSTIPISLPAGAATWNNITQNSGPFFYTSGGVQYLRQRFDLDGVYIAGPGGIWVVDVPVTTIATVVPEPASALLLVLGALALRRRA